jgi:energy-converting hydrogenase Eha subunit F
MQNLPVSFLSSVLQKLTDTDVTGITIDTDTEEDHALRSFWESRGIHTVYLFPIKCLESDFIGVFGVDFIKRDGFITDEIYDHLRAESLILSGYIASISVDKNNK